MNRFAAMHDCPLLTIRARMAVFTAASMSAEGMTINGSLPPSSSTLFLICFAAAEATLAPAADTLPDGFYRYPTIAAGTIVFASEGDLWKVPAAGGVAMRLPAYEGEEKFAALSPDDGELRGLLRECLAFEPRRRPTHTQLIARARALAHGGESLVAWAARHVAEGTDVVGEVG